VQTPDEWLADFEAKVADLQQKATQFKTNVEASGTAEQSLDGAVSVTVAASGALIDLHLTDAALRKTPDDLAAEILTLTRKARQTAASKVAQAFTPLGGDDNIVQQIPTPAPTPTPTPDTPTKPHPTTDDDFATPTVHNTDQW
jgi:DNA-binding protein YbaB